MNDGITFTFADATDENTRIEVLYEEKSDIAKNLVQLTIDKMVGSAITDRYECGIINGMTFVSDGHLPYRRIFTRNEDVLKDITSKFNADVAVFVKSVMIASDPVGTSMASMRMMSDNICENLDRINSRLLYKL